MRKRIKNFFEGGETQEQDNIRSYLSAPWMGYYDENKWKFPEWYTGRAYLDEGELKEPDWDKAINMFFDNLQNMENNSKKGFRNGKYYPYIDGLTGNSTIGNGVDLVKNPKYSKEAANGISPERMRKIERELVKDEHKYFIQRITKEGGDYKKIPVEWYAGLYDMYWQLGNGLYSTRDENGLKTPAYQKFWHALANLDYNGVFNESLTTANGVKMNTRRDQRNDVYWLPGKVAANIN